MGRKQRQARRAALISPGLLSAGSSMTVEAVGELICTHPACNKIGAWKLKMDVLFVYLSVGPVEPAQVFGLLVSWLVIVEIQFLKEIWEIMYPRYLQCS